MSASVNALFLFVHLSCAAVWIGGMFFAHFALRPAAALLEPEPRLRLMAATLRNFFRIVAAAVGLILISGHFLLANAGFSAAPTGWQVMTILGWVMALVFVYIYGILYPSLQKHVSQLRWPEAGSVLNRIRQLVFMNLCLGAVVFMAAISIRI